MSDGRMLAREWVIAARFHDPADYGIPEAPVLPADECASGELSLRDPESDVVVMVADAPVHVRR
ncbi:hypothetical protein EI982_05640 [Haloplanus rallus]|uniref:Uncharacterized protein n=1 Tax=Haloplanus rallus TaxID=1816183 RepID=A0A6B9F1Z9_9EURY|nr:hypothetical protein [Haloplanus rallus]QGX94306.1 hypothetical protein EI982_05640 [Haloplanus rallus]